VLHWLFIIAAAITVAVILFGMMDEHVMPLACPACHYDGTRATTWYRATDRGVRCRSCKAAFREHANGSLVRDYG
jgi:hypothetical protein